jgi:single-strand DNA-binding protein
MGQTKTGTTMCKFRVAVNRKISKDNEKSSFLPVVVFGKDAVNCGEFLTKGRFVMVSGNFETDSYVDKEGNKRTGFDVIAREVIFGSGGQRSDDDSSDNSGQNSYGSSKGKGYGQAEKYLNNNRGGGGDGSRGR